MHGRITLTLRGPDGRIKRKITTRNLIVTTGKNAIADQLLASPSSSKPSHMAIGTGSNAPAAGDTTLQTELDRNALTSKTRSGNTLTFVGDWAQGDGTGALTEAGIFDASSTLFARSVFGTISKTALDTLTVDWSWQLG
jgi:hypothetical protein